MYLYESIVESEHEKNGRWGKPVKYKTKKVFLHFKCNNCGNEFNRGKNGKRLQKTDTHFCDNCPKHSLANKITHQIVSKKSELRGQKFDRGYKEIWVGNDYPYRDALWLREHIVVIEQSIGRRIPVGMVVHHIDGSKTNNNINNLLLCTVAEHNNCHAKIERLVFELYNKGLVEFDSTTLEYYFKGLP
jgi:ribosomal protein L44E